jgi:DNA polymerase III gamma/tau subunit
VHRLLAEGQNLQHFCREAIGHFRNLLVARVCGADSELIAAPADERPRLKRASEVFSEEDLTRFFQILLHTDEDLRRKPDARLHLEMGLLRMVNAARLTPLEELLADLEGGAPASPSSVRSSIASAQAPPTARLTAPVSYGAGASQFAATAAAPARAPSAPVARPENPAPTSALREEANPVPKRIENVPSAIPGMIARSGTAGSGLVEAQVDSIKSAILAQEKFLGELVGNASRWEISGGEVRLFFPTESRALAEMLQARDPMERLRNVASRILGQTVRVCVKLEAVPMAGATSSGARELRAKFEQDPIVRAMLERFGGQISDVKRRGEE